MSDNCLTYSFCDEIISAEALDLSSNFNFAIDESKRLRKMVDNLKSSIPYSVNVIKELHVNENANSRILCSLLKYRTAEDGYWILRSFLNNIDLHLDIQNPIINVESERIDISVRQGKDFAIIIENKIYDAALQKNQIARYIEKMNRYVKKDNIYIILLPSVPSYVFNDCCWIPEPKRNSPESKICQSCDSSNCKLLQNKMAEKIDYQFKERTRLAPFTTCIYPWLKDILTEIPESENLLKSAIIQYIDYLGDYFLIDEKYDFIHMKTQEYIENKLSLSDKSSADKIKILSDKIEDIETLLEEMITMKEQYQTDYAQEKWPEASEEITDNLNRIAEEFGMLPVTWNVSSAEDEYFWNFKKKSWRLGIMFKKLSDGNCEVAIGLPEYEDCGVQEKNAYLGNHAAAGWPYGWYKLWEESDLPQFVDNIKSGQFEQDVKEAVAHVLGIIKTNSISMK